MGAYKGGVDIDNYKEREGGREGERGLATTKCESYISH